MNLECIYKCGYLAASASKLKRHLVGQRSNSSGELKVGRQMLCWMKAVNDPLAQNIIAQLTLQVDNRERKPRSHKGWSKTETADRSVVEGLPVDACADDMVVDHGDDEDYDDNGDGNNIMAGYGQVNLDAKSNTSDEGSEDDVDSGGEERDDDAIDGDEVEVLMNTIGTPTMYDIDTLSAVISVSGTLDVNAVRHFRLLSSDDQSLLLRAFMNGGPDDEICLNVLRKNLLRLRNGVWLDDVVLNGALDEVGKHLGNDVHFFSSFFYEKLMERGTYTYSNVSRWSRRVYDGNIFALRRLLFPINEGNFHWIGVEINFTSKQIIVMDPFGAAHKQVERVLLRYLQDEHKSKHGRELETSDWSSSTVDYTTQENWFDCGVFTYKYLVGRALNSTLLFSRSSIVSV
jgi:hypothetical protein